MCQSINLFDMVALTEDLPQEACGAAKSGRSSNI